jgi:hypothetical protein
MTRIARKRLTIGTALAVAVGIAAAVAVQRHSQAKKKGDKPAVTLEFVAREVVQPVWATMPVTLEFSGPLVAPNSAIVRAKAAGTLVGLHVQEGPAPPPRAPRWPRPNARTRQTSAWRRSRSSRRMRWRPRARSSTVRARCTRPRWPRSMPRASGCARRR